MTSHSSRPASPGRLLVTWLRSRDVGRDLLTRIAADASGHTVDEVRVVHACRTCGSDRHGKLQVRLPPGARPLHLSLGRSGDQAVVAVSDAGPVGVDVEATGPASSGLVTWVRKESVVKATGHGLTIDPDAIGVSEPDAPPALQAWPESEPIGAPVWMFDLPAPDGYVAAATVLAPAPPVVTPEAAPAG
ncbi:4'-phosphopantetheinyl transferase superfamily protein [Aeromicrobium stalagmiti]|uniref:4'-phosphopantetheinyl transferase superfamily protein n=1 Tax=Aeromicrobium stalagmiti TaxID=2738988 RepID=UPI0015692BAD|nr:4'-phosphopantetheinyl transferase superfamily protein [Aeromicrobium stalagmiti]NRQ51339.1 hypothetical protein [Aeromicrobium stalagmiti]